MSHTPRQARSLVPSATRKTRSSGCCRSASLCALAVTVTRLPLQVNAARDERIKEIETQTQLEMEAKDAEVAALQARLKKVTLFEEQQRKLEEERCAS